MDNPGNIIDVELSDVTRNRFLNYAVSVITSRALPDVRDGLKPVQRRILYTMAHDLRLTPDKSTLKCAKVVGQVLGNYHPHGDAPVYEALVRMAQPWTMRYPLVFGQGNFGSMDGDAAAAYRYTEARLTPIAMEFVSELGQETVDYKRNFDDSGEEPVVLPARVPQLLVNGCTGIAVGVATNIPPHNLTEICSACEALIENPETTTEQLLQHVQGPDFPTGGEVLEDKASLRALYQEGQGRVRIRGQYKLEEEPRKGPLIVVTSIPYMVNKAQLVEEIAELIVARKIPQLVDVRDESTEDVRIVLECKKDSDCSAVMAYLYKHTAMQSSFHVNMTCLVDGGPQRLGLRDCLKHFVNFRHEVLKKRLEFELRALLRRIHILEGFITVFDDLDTAIQIIRDSDGRQDSANKLMARFGVDLEQVNAVLDLALHKLARPDIRSFRDELRERQTHRKILENTLASDSKLWSLVKKEIAQVREKYGDARRTAILETGATELEYAAEAFIVEEEAIVLLTRDGWLRRVSANTDLAKLRYRQDDELLTIIRGSTLNNALFLSNLGTAYTIRLHDIPVTKTGFGDPIQKFFNFDDGERVVQAFSLDPLATEGLDDGDPPRLQALVLTTDGRGFRCSLQPFLEASTKSGRRYARPAAGAEVLQVLLTEGVEMLVVASRMGRALVCPVQEVNYFGGAGKGVTVLKLSEDDRLLGAVLSKDPQQGLTLVRHEGGKPILVNPCTVKPASRGGRGHVLIKRGQLKEHKE